MAKVTPLRISNKTSTFEPFFQISVFLFLEAMAVNRTLHRSGARAGTRVPCEIPITLTSLDPDHPFSEPCQIVLVNLRGCAATFRRSVKVGVAVRLEGLTAMTHVTGRVVNCISLGEREKLWLLGLALDEPGNVWGIPVPLVD